MLEKIGLHTKRNQIKVWIILTVIMIGSSIMISWINMSSDASQINIAGRQRMLSQRVAQEALLVKEGVAEPSRVQKTIDLFEKSHRALLEGNRRMGLTGVSDPEIRQQLEKVQRMWREYKEAIQQVVEEPTPQALRKINEMAPEVLSEMHQGVTMMASTANNSAHSRQITNILMQTGILTLFVVGIVSVFSLIATVRSVTQHLQTVAKGDFTHFAPSGGRDEAAEIYAAYNQILNKQGGMLQRIVDESQQLASSSEELTATSEEIKNNTSHVSREVGQITQSAQEVNEVVHDVANNIQEVSDAASESSRATEQGKETVNSASSRISELEEATGKINDIIETIQSIAKKTDLLALNAAIEAANAGEAGKGFAVVADEVRKLAEKTSQATGEVYNIVEELRSKSSSSVEAIKDIESSISLIQDKVSDTDTRASQIAASTEELSATMSETTENMGSISSSVSQVTDSVEAIHHEADQLGDLAQDLRNDVQKFHLPENIQATTIWERAKGDHLAWKTALRDLLKGKKSISEEEATSHKQCRLGKWLYEEGGLTEYAHLSEMNQLEKEHEHLHNLVTEVLQEYNVGNTQEANQKYSEFKESSDRIVKLLDTLEEKTAA